MQEKYATTVRIIRQIALTGWAIRSTNSEPLRRTTADGYSIMEFVVHLTDHAHLHRLVYGTADAAAIALCKQSDEAILAPLTNAIKTHLARETDTDRDVDLLASLIFHGLDGALHRAIMPGSSIDRPRFIDEVKRFTAGALGLPPPASP